MLDYLDFKKKVLEMIGSKPLKSTPLIKMTRLIKF